MNIFFSTLLSLFFTLTVGYSLISLTGYIKNSNIVYKSAIAYGAGVGVLAIQMMLYSFFRIPWNGVTLFFPWIIMIIYLFISKKENFQKQTFPIKIGNGLNKLILALIFFSSFFVISQASIRPLVAFDGWANWFLAGKAYYLHGFLDPSYIAYADNSSAPILSLFISFVYLISGFANEQAALILFSLFFLSIIIVFYFSVRNFMTQRYALVFTLLLTLTGNLIRHGGRFDVGHGDLILGFYLFCSSVIILQIYKKFTIPALLFFNLFITTAALLKSEGIPIFVVSQVIVFLILTKNKKYNLKYFAVTFLSLFVISSWYIFKHSYNLPENPFFQPNINLERIPIVIFGIVREYFNVIRWNLLWIAFFTSLIIFYRNKYSFILGIICLSQLSIYFTVYLTTPLSPLNHIESSYDRLLLHLAPTAMLMIAISFYSYFRENNKPY